MQVIRAPAICLHNHRMFVLQICELLSNFISFVWPSKWSNSNCLIKIGPSVYAIVIDNRLVITIDERTDRRTEKLLISHTLITKGRHVASLGKILPVL